MSQSYKGQALEFLANNNISVGDTIKVTSDITYHGIVMPRYEKGDDHHIVLKLNSGYNIGIDISDMQNLTKISSPDIETDTSKDNDGDTDTNNKTSNRSIKSKGLAKILLLSTGGTIASKIDYRTGAVTPLLTAQQLNSSVPELADLADISTENILAEYSENMTIQNWLDIAAKINSYAKSDYKGIILAHGTDTMHYTSAFLSFALAGFPIPIVLVGSQRSSDRASSDAALNLIGAVRFIVESRTLGVYVAMHQDENDNNISCHIGTRVRKNHTSKRGAFQTIGDDPAFIVTESSIQKNMREEFYSTSFEPKICIDNKVALVKYHPGFDPNIIKNLIDMKYRGIIFEGTGLGHVGKTTYDAIRLAKESGMFLGMTSQCIDGRTCMTVYESGRDLLDLGIIPLANMIPEVALVKAMWAMGHHPNNEIRDIMLKEIAAEMR